MTCVPPGPDGAGRLHVVWRFRPCCLMHPWAAARPLAVRAASCCLLPRQISGRRAACPPARRPRRELRSARRLEARPGPAGLAAASNRSGVSVCCLARPCRPWAPQTGTSGALRTSGAGALLVPQFWLSTSNFARNSSMTHSNIEFTSLELQRFRASRKMTRINYVRNLAGGGVVAAHGRRVWGLQARWPGGLKPSSPSRVRNGRFWCIFRAQRCRWFQRCRVGGEQWCCWFYRRHVSACCARNLSSRGPGG